MFESMKQTTNSTSLRTKEVRSLHLCNCKRQVSSVLTSLHFNEKSQHETATFSAQDDTFISSMNTAGITTEEGNGL